MTKTQLLALVLAVATAQAQAAESKKASGETSVKIEQVKKAENEVKKTSENDEADQVITNRKLRAETGSLSMWSMNSSFSFSGGTIEKPMDAERPNLTGASATLGFQTFSGSVGVKYRVGKLDSMRFGIGLRWVAPFTDTINTDNPNQERKFRDQDNKFDLDNPGLSWTHLAKLGPVQSVTSVGPTVYTTDFLQELGYLASLGVSQSFVMEVVNRLSVGVAVNTSYSIFSKDVDETTRTGMVVGPNQSDYGLGVYPSIEYVLNDTFNLRTVSGVWVYEHARTKAGWEFSKNLIYQSVGVGISVTRDIYLYPNIQFLTENIRADLTNVAVNASINVF